MGWTSFWYTTGVLLYLAYNRVGVESVLSLSMAILYVTNVSTL